MKGKNLSQKLMSVLLVLIAIAVIIIAFVGIYLPNLNKLSNIIPDYKLGAEIDGIIEYRFSVDNSEDEKQVYVDSNGKIRGEVPSSNTTSAEGEESKEPENNTGFNIETRKIKVNEDSALTKENFEKAKQLIENRLENAGATEYAIRLDDVTGNMIVELSQNDNIEYLYEVALNSKGTFEIVDDQTGVILMNRTHLKKAAGAYNYDEMSNTYSVYLQLELTEEGAKLINEISKTYIQYVDEAGESKTDYISIKIDGSQVMRTYFNEEYNSAVLNIPISTNVVANDLNTYTQTVNDIAYTLNNEEMPIVYTTGGNAPLFIKSNLNENAMTIFNIAVMAILVVITIIFIIKYKLKGFFAGILNAALVGLVILVLKLTKVTISISSLTALAMFIIINFVFMIIYLNNLNKKKEQSYLETLKSFYSVMFPVIVIAFVFTFFVSTTVAGLGSVLFWGMLLQIVFNTLVAKYVLE